MLNPETFNMIAHIKGLLIEKSPTEVVLEVNGIGYSINISLNTFLVKNPPCVSGI